MSSFSALAEPNRLKIVEMLAAQKYLSASDIAHEFTISAPAVSQHLKVLKEAKLVNVEVRAQQRIYTLNLGGISEVEEWVSKVRRMWEEKFDALDEFLKKEMKKSKRKKKDKP
jgi:DNA-binding transcriptional ArsR family regulator